jgi:hypothetical protein
MRVTVKAPGLGGITQRPGKAVSGKKRSALNEESKECFVWTLHSRTIQASLTVLPGLCVKFFLPCIHYAAGENTRSR